MVQVVPEVQVVRLGMVQTAQQVVIALSVLGLLVMAVDWVLLAQLRLVLAVEVEVEAAGLLLSAVTPVALQGGVVVAPQVARMVGQEQMQAQWVAQGVGMVLGDQLVMAGMLKLVVAVVAAVVIVQLQLVVRVVVLF